MSTKTSVKQYRTDRHNQLINEVTRELEDMGLTVQRRDSRPDLFVRPSWSIKAFFVEVVVPIGPNIILGLDDWNLFVSKKNVAVVAAWDDGWCSAVFVDEQQPAWWGGSIWTSVQLTDVKWLSKKDIPLRLFDFEFPGQPNCRPVVAFLPVCQFDSLREALESVYRNMVS